MGMARYFQNNNGPRTNSARPSWGGRREEEPNSLINSLISAEVTPRVTNLKVCSQKQRVIGCKGGSQ